MSQKRKNFISETECTDFLAASSSDDERGQQSFAQSRQRASMLATRLYNSNNFRPPDVGASSSSVIGSLHPDLHPLFTSPTYFDIGDCNQICEYCKARFWFEERIISSPRNQRPKYNQCCKSGRVRLQFPEQPPTSIKQLFANIDFLHNIRAYNSMFAMTSFGATIDESINKTFGPYVFKVEGQISHWMGSLCPPLDENPRFLQMYIYDTENEISNRLRYFNDYANPPLDSEIIRLLIETLDNQRRMYVVGRFAPVDNSNNLVKLFRTARDLCLSTNVPQFVVRLYTANNQKGYDAPTLGTIGAIVYDDKTIANDFDIVIYLKDGPPQRINKLHPLYMALQFPLLFLFGEHGWSPELRLKADGHTRDRQLTMNMFYNYQLHDRLNLYTLLLRGGRLFQQYLVDAYICIEQNRLDYIRLNQSLFRTEYFQGIHDALLRGDSDGQDVGKRTILPSSFTGGPRYMYKHYQDALAICRVHGNPQYFITFTCNVKWPEITRYVQDTSVKVSDRPDIIARVFKLKVEAFIKYLKSGVPFGQVAADLYTIEFQKRGLPHCHTLLWVTASHKIQNAEQVDKFISAELPDPVAEHVLHKIITDSMMHGPCGPPKENEPCMHNRVCSKKFPKKHEPATRFDKDGYVYYRRRLNGQTITKSGVLLDNAYVVPYNKNPCLRFQAHINVEYCGWSMMIKYLFKYISKGADRIRFKITNQTAVPDNDISHCTTDINEIQNFVDGRFICPHEAAWRIFDFPIHDRNPPVQILAVHLENMQNVTFKDTQQLHNIVNNPVTKLTTLTEWLHNNRTDETGRHLRYIDYLTEYKWDSFAKGWSRRTSNRTPAIGRLIYIHPTCGETFYLRMLLAHQVGCQTFTDIRTVSSVIFSTYRGACESLGLLGDDKEWTCAFKEASAWATPVELRSLFTHMLLFCEISNPLALWKEHWRRMSDDIISKLTTITSMKNIHINDNDLQDHVLYEIEFY